MRTLLLAAVWYGGSFALLAPPVANQAVAAASIPGPRDQPFAGEIHLDVDASDVDRRIVHVKETISGLSADTVLLYPKWLPGTHAPEGPIDRVAGLTMASGGKTRLMDPGRGERLRLSASSAGGHEFARAALRLPLADQRQGRRRANDPGVARYSSGMT